MKVQDPKQLTALWEEHNGEILDLAEKHASTYFDSTIDRVGHIGTSFVSFNLLISPCFRTLSLSVFI
jgi:hypothetical protein